MPPGDGELEREIHDALRRLPMPRAPRSLAPRVLQAIAAAEAPVRRAAAPAWRQWPLEWRLVGLVAAMSLAAALVLAVPFVTDWVGSLPATRALVGLWRAFIAPVAVPVLVFAAVMSGASALLAGALGHVAWEGRETHS